MVSRAISLLKHSSLMLVPQKLPGRGSYNRADFFRDFSAGCTVAAVLVPQSIGYALLAGLPPIHGLYAALVSGIAGALWGGNRFLSTGPIAIVSLLTLTAISSIAAPGSAEFITLAAALALMVGVLQLGMGLTRLGFLVRLVPQSVLVGFSSAAALIIACTQLPHLLGFSTSQNQFVFQIIGNILRHIGDLHALTAAIGVASLAILLLMRRAFPHLPAALVVLVGGIAASFALNLGEYGVQLAGAIPARLPISDIPNFSPETFLILGKQAMVIALVGFMSSYAIVKDISRRTRERVSPDRELIGQGFANIFVGLFRGYPVGGSLSRTAINYDAGAVTRWAGIYASGVVACSILFLAPVLAYLPNAILAATLVAAVIQLVDVHQLRSMSRVSPMDGVIAATTFVTALIFKPDDAILIGVVLALALFLHRMMWVDVVEIGIDPKWNILRGIHGPETPVERLPHMLMLRIDSSFFYANSERLVEKMRASVQEREESRGERVEFVVLDCAGIDFIDGTGMEELHTFLNELEERGTSMCLMYTHRNIRHVLDKAGVSSRVRMIRNIAELRMVCSEKSTAAACGLSLPLSPVESA